MKEEVSPIGSSEIEAVEASISVQKVLNKLTLGDEERRRADVVENMNKVHRRIEKVR